MQLILTQANLIMGSTKPPKMSVTIACVGESELNKVSFVSLSCVVCEKIAPCQL